MKAGVTFAMLLAFCSLGQTAPDAPSVVPAAKNRAGQVVVAGYTDGKFTDAPDTITEKLREVMPHAEIRPLKNQEAEAIWAGDASLLEMAKSIKGANLVIGLWDSRGKKFYQTVTSIELAESTKKTLAEVWSRHEGIVRMLAEADSKTGDERLQLLGNAATVAGFPGFAASYPEIALELANSTTASVQFAREQIKAALESNARSEKLNRLHFELSMSLRTLPPGSSERTRVEAIDKFIQEMNLSPELKQLMAMRKYLVWSGARNYPEALAVLDEVHAMLPESKLAAKIPGIRATIIEKMKNNTQEPSLDGNVVPAPLSPEAQSPKN